jgi:DNA-binding FadR family transcriptional regulator
MTLHASGGPSGPELDAGYPIRPILPVSRLDEVEVRIKEYIAKNELKPGDRLPGETWFCAQLGVGRPLVREAFKGLEAVGVLEARKGIGRFVRAFEAETYLRHFTTQMLIHSFSERELYETRCLLEIAVAANAVTRLTDDDLADLQRYWDRIVVDTAAGITNSAADFGLHRVIMSRADNRFIVAMLDAVYALTVEHARDAEPQSRQKMIEDLHQHEAIVDAARARDGQAARAALIAHFETTATRAGFEPRWRDAFAREPIAALT